MTATFFETIIEQSTDTPKADGYKPNNKKSATHPTPPQETLLILHLNPLLLFLRQLLKEALTLANHILYQLLRQSRLAQIQKPDIQQCMSQVLEKLGFRGWI
jgi:hypothetical protein|tara:strand:- start:9002 stop:9307 length:306 start_codon:yes stop_codon:yes gene_type:complete